MKLIYQPKGAAGEYAKYACNIYVGCSNQCTYCYCSKGFLGRVCGNTPKLKKGLEYALKSQIILEEQREKDPKLLSELRKHGVFFSFTTDPLLRETMWRTWHMVDYLKQSEIHSVVLTKSTDWFHHAGFILPKTTKIGFTLTGHDELEPFAAKNSERIALMRLLHRDGYKTWASIEPIINIPSSINMIMESMDFCDEYKIGLMDKGVKYDKKELIWFYNLVNEVIPKHKLYWKQSFLKAIK